jgi:uncharacterized protein with GYD domain
MPKYLTTFTYSSGSWARMIDRPEDRTTAAQNVVEALGGTLECIYWQMNSEDGLAIADFPDSIAANAVQAAIVKTGAFKSVDMHELLTRSSSARAWSWQGTPRRCTRYPVSHGEVRAGPGDAAVVGAR